ncbi:diuretic hormone receptor-like isoform X2 [Chironomus tepperi]|uniref:diuretic hormone receptor-like isoform X2 n=1 Tax=Chironomus tepperi TaxID=113505 RepID=UPI00391F8036
MYVVASTEVNESFPYGNLFDFDNQTLASNDTDVDGLSCLYEHISALTNLSGCPPTHDKVLCWPPTPYNTLATQRCMFTVNGMQYDEEDNATKFCNAEGIWEKSMYDSCLHASPHSVLTHDVEYNTIIYCIGYSMSIIVLTIAVIIFVTFKELRCLRNTIHCNLFITYIFSALLWLLTLSFQMSSTAGLIECILLLTLLQFFNLTNFFWMMVEGLYLYLLVVETFSRIEVINKFAVYAIIGYGVPAVVALTWSIFKGYVGSGVEDSLEIEVECLWMQESGIDWIFKGPACAVLLINLIFLTSIMWVLITKLRSANTAETRQYRKASKALLVLIPLFGLTYLIVLYGPNEGIGRKIFDIARAFLLSTQGFFVALFYCFLNSEVRKAIKKSINRWRDARNIIRPQLRHSSNQTTRRYINNGAHQSPHSHTESLRPLTGNTKKRESNVTTTTILTEVPSNYCAVLRESNGAFPPRNSDPLMGLEENSV